MTALPINRFVGAVTMILVIQAAFFYSASHGEVPRLAAPLSAFPIAVGPWRLLQEGVIEQEELDVLKADDTLTRYYGSPEGAANLFIAYFKTQRTGQSPHSPKNCLPGSGWQPEPGSGTVDIRSNGETLHINRYLVSKGEDRSVVLYWYQSQGRVIANEFAAKFYLVADSIRKHRSDTSLVRVVVPVGAGGTERAETIGVDFVKAFYPAIKAWLPQ